MPAVWPLEFANALWQLQRRRLLSGRQADTIIDLAEPLDIVVHEETPPARRLLAVALMRQGRVVELDADLALNAAKLGREHGLPLTDSVILSTARRFGATVWTQDGDFEELDGVRYIQKR